MGASDKCRPASLYAYADYAQSNLLLRQGDVLPMTAENQENIFSTVGINITGGKYIAYNNPDLLSHLAGKTITIELASVVGTTSSVNQSKFYIADF